MGQGIDASQSRYTRRLRTGQKGIEYRYGRGGLRVSTSHLDVSMSIADQSKRLGLAPSP